MTFIDLLYNPLTWAFVVPTFICACLVFLVDNGDGILWPRMIAFWFIMLAPCVAVVVMLTR